MVVPSTGSTWSIDKAQKGTTSVLWMWAVKSENLHRRFPASYRFKSSSPETLGLQPGIAVLCLLLTFLLFLTNLSSSSTSVKTGTWISSGQRPVLNHSLAILHLRRNCRGLGVRCNDLTKMYTSTYRLHALLNPVLFFFLIYIPSAYFCCCCPCHTVYAERIWI